MLETARGQVEERKRSHRIPKNPEDVLTSRLRDEAQDASEKLTKNKDKVAFVVHGRNLAALDSMRAFLRSIGLQPFTLSEALSQTGKTSPYIGEILETAFSLAQATVILMTPDDEGRLRSPFRKPNDPKHETQLTSQARLNVIFEAGMAMGKHGNRTILVELGGLRPFSDISGRLTVRLDNSINKRKDLATRLQIAGCHPDLSGKEWFEAGDFEGVL